MSVTTRTAPLDNHEVRVAVVLATGANITKDTAVEVYDSNDGVRREGYAYVVVKCPRLRTKSTGGWFARAYAQRDAESESWREHMALYASPAR